MSRREHISQPATRASHLEASTPPTGPERRVEIGSRGRRMSAAPPELRHHRQPPRGSGRRAPSCSSSSARDVSTAPRDVGGSDGRGRPLVLAVGRKHVARDEDRFVAPPSASTISRARCSCAGFSNENRNAIAIGLDSGGTKLRQAWRTPSSSSGHHDAGRRRRYAREPRALGRRGPAVVGTASRSKSVCRWVRRISSTSRNPAVVIRPVGHRQRVTSRSPRAWCRYVPSPWRR